MTKFISQSNLQPKPKNLLTLYFTKDSRRFTRRRFDRLTVADVGTNFAISFSAELFIEIYLYQLIESNLSKQRKKMKMQGVFEQNRIASSVIDRTKGTFGNKIGLFGQLFGCWHKALSRPFTNKNGSYRACLSCGARKRFDTETLKTDRRFYYPPAVSFDKK